MLNIITNMQIGCNNIITDINNTIVSEHYNISNNDGKITILECVWIKKRQTRQKMHE